MMLTKKKITLEKKYLSLYVQKMKIQLTKLIAR